MTDTAFPGAARRHGPDNRLEVVAAVITRESGDFLLAQRPAGKVYAGYWEFPGGKVEHGEEPAAALRRELCEELGIDVVTAYPWITRTFDYEHAAVRLRFFRVTQWRGAPHGRELQQISWQSVRNIEVAPVLPANGPILRALDLPPVYGITCAAACGRDAFMLRLERALRAGLRLVQVREKAFDTETLCAFAREVVAMGKHYRARVLVNAGIEVVQRSGADGMHLNSEQLMAARRRPDCDWCIASCHGASELQHAMELGLDAVVLGAVASTPSHPGVTPLGWTRFESLVADCTVPVFALGGMRGGDLEQAWRRGAHGVAMIRGAWAG